MARVPVLRSPRRPPADCSRRRSALAASTTTRTTSCGRRPTASRTTSLRRRRSRSARSSLRKSVAGMSQNRRLPARGSGRDAVGSRGTGRRSHGWWHHRADHQRHDADDVAREALTTGHANRVTLITDVGRDEFNGGVYRTPSGRISWSQIPAQYDTLVREQFGGWRRRWSVSSAQQIRIAVHGIPDVHGRLGIGLPDAAATAGHRSSCPCTPTSTPTRTTPPVRI